MSTNFQSANLPKDNFTAIFDAASSEYQSVTGICLDSHPFNTQLSSGDTPKAISEILRIKAQAFDELFKGDEDLMTWLDPTIQILLTLSATLGEEKILPFSPAKLIVIGLAILFEAVRDAASHKTLIHLFERVRFSLQRVEVHVETPLTEELTDLLGKIMAQVLSILALSTKIIVEKKTMKFLKRLMGRRTKIEDALQQLDLLTMDFSAQLYETLVNVNDQNADETMAIGEATLTRLLAEIEGNQLKERLRAWLSPPDPSINHNHARESQQCGTAEWFLQGDILRAWKTNGSVLWISGNPGAGKSVLCSAIIEDIDTICKDGSTLIAYYYFDFKDSSKHDVRGMLKSLLLQLGECSSHCWDALHQLYNTCRDGSKQPSEASLVKSLKTMLELSAQVPVFVILDALDECPSTTGTPSAREKVLAFVEDLVLSNHPNLFMCITSRPEQDIQTVLNPLTSASLRVSLHEESGQREDISHYVRSFVYSDRAMRRWRKEDREMVINTLSERAGGTFRWVYCQLDTLRRCMPSSLRKLNELPTTLDGTYERILQEIPKEQ